jgi:hypothetical protein
MRFLATLLPMSAKSPSDMLNLALRVAVGRGDAAHAAALVEDGADPRARDDEGRDALILAARFHSDACVQLFLPLCDLHAVDNKGAGAFALAAKFCGDAVAADFARLTPCPNARDEIGECALWAALCASPPKFLTIDALLERDIEESLFPPPGLRFEPLRAAASMAWSGEPVNAAAVDRALAAVLRKMEGRPAERAAIAGDVLLSLAENGLELERILGPDPDGTRSRCAIALASVSGDDVVRQAAEHNGAGSRLAEALRAALDERVLAREVGAVGRSEQLAPFQAKAPRL